MLLAMYAMIRKQCIGMRRGRTALHRIHMSCLHCTAVSHKVVL